MSLDYAVRVVANGIDVSPNVVGLSVRHGRQTVAEAMPPNSCTFDLLDYDGPLRVADSVAVDIRIGAGEWERFFTGTVTDHEARPYVDPATMETVGSRRFICISSGLGRMARRRIGDAPWGTDSDSERIQRILDLCPDVVQGTIDDDGPIYFKGRDIDSQDAYRIASQYAQEAWGMMLDGRDGRVHYHSQYHRNVEEDPVTPLYSWELETTPRLVERVGGIINRAGVGYGAADQKVYERDDESIAKHGLYDFYQGTEINDQSSATLIAQLLVHLYKEPRLTTEEVVVPVSRLGDAERAEAIARLGPASYVSMFGWPEPAPDPWPVWVEGVLDEFDGTSWTRTMTVTDRHGAPRVDPPDPPDVVPCDEFDFLMECSSDCLFPHGVAVQDALAVSDVGWQNGDNEWWVEHNRNKHGELFQSVRFMPLSAVEFGSQGPHPHPWLGGGTDPSDFCVGYEFARWYLNGQPYDFGVDPPVFEYRETLTSANYWPCRFVPLLILASWEPTDGWQEGEATFADGTGPPTGWVAFPGCRGIRYSTYADLFPGTTRAHTRNGRWEASVMLTLIAEEESQPPFPVAGAVRMINPSDVLRLEVGQHWARKAF